MKLFLALLPFIFLTACDPVAVIPARAPTAPPPAEHVAPMVDAAQNSEQKVRQAGERLEGRVVELSQNATALHNDMMAAVAEADKLRKQKTATEEQLTDLWRRLTEITNRNMFLEKEADDALNDANAQKLARVELEKQIGLLKKAGVAKDQENDTLTSQNGDKRLTISDQGEIINKLNARAVAAEKNAAVGSYLKGCVWVLGILLFLAVLFFILIRTKLISI